MDPRKQLSRRERQILDAVYRLGEGTVADVREQIPDPPGYDSIRTTMRLLEEKGILSHRSDGPRYVYQATVEKGAARRSALHELVRTFFDGSAEAAALARAPEVLARYSWDAAAERTLAHLDRIARR